MSSNLIVPTTCSRCGEAQPPEAPHDYEFCIWALTVDRNVLQRENEILRGMVQKKKSFLDRIFFG